MIGDNLANDMSDNDNDANDPDDEDTALAPFPLPKLDKDG